jgi:hypothetical protein
MAKRLISQIRGLPKSLPALLGLTILIGSVFSSCHFPTENKNSTLYSQLEIVQADGTGHRILATGIGVIAALTDSAVFFSGADLSSVSKVNYDGSNLGQFHPEIPWAIWDFSNVNHKVLLASYWSDSTGVYNALYLMNADGTDLVQLAMPKGSYDYPHISPDLDQIVFCSGGGVETIRPDGTNLNLIRSEPDSGYCDNSFFLDENNIIYRITETTNVEEDEQVRLFGTATRKDELIGSFHSGNIEGAHGQKVLYVQFATLLLLDISTSQITTLGSNVYGAAFSPDGSEIAAIDNSNLYIMDASGGNKRTIYTQTDNKKMFEEPQFSPDGKYVVFRTSWY